MPDLKLVYDFGSRLPRLGINLIPLVLAVMGLAIFYYNRSMRSNDGTAMFGINRRKYNQVFGLIFSAFAGVFAIITIGSDLKEYFLTRSIYKNKRFEVVEGKFEHYHSMPEGGHDSERFKVHGIPFEFSAYDLSDYGYNHAASKGGVIKENLYVRIAYFHNGERNVILKLQIE